MPTRQSQGIWKGSPKRIDLDTEAEIPGISVEQFTQQTEAAKVNYPVSRALAGVEITLKANLMESSS